MNSEEHPALEVKEGDVIAEKYRVDRVLGEGGMGIVVAATHTVLGDKVALKFLGPSLAKNETTSARFLREARAAAAIKSPNVARVLDVGTLPDTGSPYMVMELMTGHDLGIELENHGPLPPERVAHFAQQTCEALAAAHAAGVVHRDIKPSNLFLTSDADGSALVKVLDFGISKVETTEDASLTATQASIGSPLYMSPEQMRSARDVDHRTDIWSLGVVMFELLTEELPFMAESMPQLVATVLEEEAPDVRTRDPDVPADLAEIIAGCLVKEPDGRFQSVAALANALAPLAGEFGGRSAGRTSRILGIEEIAPYLTDTGERTTKEPGSARGTAATLPDSVRKSETGTSFGRTAPDEERRFSKVWFAVAAVLLVGAVLFFARGGDESGTAQKFPAKTGPSEAEQRTRELAEEAARLLSEAEAHEKKAREAEERAKAAREAAEKSKSDEQAQEAAEEEQKKAEEAVRNAEAARAAAKKKQAQAAGKAKPKPRPKAPKPQPKPKGSVFDSRL